MDIFIFVLLVVFVLQVYTLLKLQSNQKPEVDTREITLEILKANAEQNQKLVELLESLKSTQKEDVSTLFNKQIVELNTLKTSLDNELNKQIERNNLNFSKIQNQNLDSLNNLQTKLQEQLTLAVKNLLESNKTELDKLSASTKSQFDILNKTNSERLDQINKQVQSRMDENFKQNLKSFQEVTQNLGRIQETATKMIDSTKSIDKLNNIFGRTSSKAFGDFGEKYLETLLNEHLAPGSWDKQVLVPGSSNQIDFVIHLDSKKIGIDAKFPVTKYQDYLDADTSENKNQLLKEYLQAVLRMAQEISTKYLQAGFVDTLFLYLPSDGMYAEVVNQPNIVEKLQKMKVTTCSPSTLFPLIMLINSYQMKMNISQNAEKIIDGLGKVKKNIDSFRDEYRKLGDKLRQAQDNYDKADRSLIGVEKNIIMLENKPVDSETLFTE